MNEKKNIYGWSNYRKDTAGVTRKIGGGFYQYRLPNGAVFNLMYRMRHTTDLWQALPVGEEAEKVIAPVSYFGARAMKNLLEQLDKCYKDYCNANKS